MSRAPKTVRTCARVALKAHKRKGGGGRKAPAFAKKLASGKTLSESDLAKMAFMGKHRSPKSGGCDSLGGLYGGKSGAKWASRELRKRRA